MTLRAHRHEPGPDIDPAAVGKAAAGAERARRDTLLGDTEISAASPSPASTSRARRSSSCPRRRWPCPQGWRGEVLDCRERSGSSAMSLDPVTLRVASGALRAACEEMGAVLVRAAHSANIKERRDASCALFDPDGEMVMQAEHIPVHLGAMPAAVAAVAEEDHEPGVAWVLNDPYAGGTHLPDITVITPGVRRRRADRLRRQPRPPRRRRRPDARLDAGRLQDARGRGRRDLAAAAGRATRSTSSRSRCASPPSAAPTCAPSSPPTAPARRGCASCTSASGPRAEGRDGGHDRLRRAPHPRGAGGPRGRHARTPRTCSRPPTATSQLSLAATVEGDTLHLDFTGSADQYDGNLNCPLAVTVSACWFAVRVLTDPDIPPSAGAHAPGQGHRARGLRCSTRSRPAAVVGRQRRDLLARRRPRARRVRPRARPGHDEQPHARQRRLHLLRDARRRPGRVRGRRRAERRARRDVEHAEHARRGARARVPAAGDRVRAAARLGRRGRAHAAATA